jgi:glutathione S-transferase
LLIKKLIPRIEAVTAKLDGMLEGKKYTTGDNLTIADFVIYTQLRDYDYMTTLK